MSSKTSARLRARVNELAAENRLLKRSADPETARLLDEVTAENESLKREVYALNAELDEAYKEPVWFSHRGDYAVLVVLAGLLGAGGMYAAKIMGWL